jgi:hypothetical protein
MYHLGIPEKDPEEQPTNIDLASLVMEFCRPPGITGVEDRQRFLQND